MNHRIKTLPGCSILDGYFCLQRPLSFLILSLGGERTISENLRQLVFSRLQDLNDRTVKIPQALGFIISAWILAAG